MNKLEKGGTTNNRKPAKVEEIPVAMREDEIPITTRAEEVPMASIIEDEIPMATLAEPEGEKKQALKKEKGELDKAYELTKKREALKRRLEDAKNFTEIITTLRENAEAIGLDKAKMLIYNVRELKRPSELSRKDYLGIDEEANAETISELSLARDEFINEHLSNLRLFPDPSLYEKVSQILKIKIQERNKKEKADTPRKKLFGIF